MTALKKVWYLVQALWWFALAATAVIAAVWFIASLAFATSYS